MLVQGPFHKGINLRGIFRNEVGRSIKGEGRDRLISEFQVSASNCSHFKHNRNEGRILPLRNASLPLGCQLKLHSWCPDLAYSLPLVPSVKEFSHYDHDGFVNYFKL